MADSALNRIFRSGDVDMASRSRAAFARMAIVAISVLGLAACGAQEVPQSVATDGALAEVAETSGVSTLVGAATDGPGVSITTPANNASVPFEILGTDIIVTVNTTDADLGTAHILAWYLDGVEVAQGNLTTHTFEDVPAGRRHLAVRVLDAGTGLPLANPSAQDGHHIKVVDDCGTAGDCDDSLACSNQACTSGTCAFGAVSGCCDHDLECGTGETCVGGVCHECAGDGECDDGNDCTTDACNLDGQCIHSVTAGCCAVDTDCDDGAFCTDDSCNAGTCTNAPSVDPLCCDSTSDCMPPNPCQLSYCYKNTIQNKQFCRFGPPSSGCCTDDSACNDGNPCTVDSCDKASPMDETGACIYESDPANPGCCVTKFDCDDTNPATLDTCEGGTCVSATDPSFCALPATSQIVINELMIAPGSGVADATGEWIELFNTGQVGVSVSGWTVTTSTGGSHTITPANAQGGASALFIPWRGHLVLARSRTSTLNGGFKPRYQMGDDIELIDALETGSATPFLLTLSDATGDEVDSVLVDGSFPIQSGRSTELTNGWLPNDDGTNWVISGNHNSPIRNQRYGNASPKQYGSPRNINRSAYFPVTDATCVIPEGSGACVIAACSDRSKCVFPNNPDCCTNDADCDDGNPCTLTACDTESATCVAPDNVDGCCAEDDECDDGNPCNLDRCIATTCRHSPDIVPGCCSSDAGCQDEDACTVESCVAFGCEVTPVVPGSGALCCNDDGECDDGLVNTNDICVAEECTNPVNPDYCDDAGDACDDGKGCTTDTCNTVTNTCIHIPQPGCCVVDEDCPDDGEACTAPSCEVVSGDCALAPVEGCCTADYQCNDSDACTVNTCEANTCVSADVAECCNTDVQCDDGQPCTSDACIANSCENTQNIGCCTPGANGATLAGQCGEDSDGPLSCMTWTCPGGTCVEAASPECCDVDGDCDDASACSYDLCQASGLCKHLPLTGPGCCLFDSDCAGGEYCGLTALCAPLKGAGDACTGDGECSSTFCVSGACCDAPCSGGADVAINEIVANGFGGGPDWVEIRNLDGGLDADISDWSLTLGGDSYTIPEGVLVPAGGWLVFEAAILGFDLDASGTLTLLTPSGDTNDTFTWSGGEADLGESAGRYPDGVGSVQSLPYPTKGGENVDELQEICGDGLCLLTEDCTTCADDCGSCGGCADALFFSQMIEGSSTNKALEIYNNTGLPVDLTTYEIWGITNGGSWPEATWALTGALAAGDSLVICNTGADAAVQAVCDITNNSICGFSGDDARGLAKGGVLVDTIGTSGSDPGSAWTVTGGTTANHTLIRREGVSAPTTDWSVSAVSNWTVLSSNDTSDIGVHTTASTCEAEAAADVTINEVTILPFIGPQWVEIVNLDDTFAADLSAWTLNDGGVGEWVLPNGTSVDPGAYLVLSAGDGVTGFDFTLAAVAGSVSLRQPAGVIVSEVSWPAGAVNAPTSWGRFPDSIGAFSTRPQVTPNAANTNTTPFCGDATCNGIETCATCTADCSFCAPVVGELAITEIMVDPEGGLFDGDAEWIEVLNLSATSLDLSGLTLHDEGTDSHIISDGTPLVIAAGAYMVLGNSNNLGAGLSPDYIYDDIVLSNGADEVVISDGATVIDSVAYDAGVLWVDPAGATLSLTATSTDPAANNDPTNWCAGLGDYAVGNLGTPGVANPTCVTAVQVAFNELTVGDGGWVEFKNLDALGTADLSGYILTLVGVGSYTLPGSSIAGADGWLVVGEGDGISTGFDFGLGAAGELTLTTPGGGAQATLTWTGGDAPSGSSWGRIPDAFGAFETLGFPTLGAVNTDVVPAICGDATCDPDETCVSCASDCGACANSCGASLMFSEYVEGDGSDKALEIYNGTGVHVDMSDYATYRISNGGDWATEGAGNGYPLTGIIAPGETYVICNDSMSDQSNCDLSISANPTFFNGDDAMGLVKNGVLVDMVGDEGADPGLGWDVGGIEDATRDHTLRRKTGITVGNTDWLASAASEWEVLPLGTFGDLGAHEAGDGCTPAPVVVDIVINEINPNDAVSDSIELINRNATVPADLSGWAVESDSGILVLLDEGTTIPGGGYLVLDESVLGQGFESEDIVTLYDSNINEVDSAIYLGGDFTADQAWGRLPDGTGDFAATNPTSGAENVEGTDGGCEAKSVLDPGDIAIINFDCDSADDFAFMALVPLAAGTEILFSDSGVKSDGTFRASEGVVTYTAPEVIAAGTVITGRSFATPAGYSSSGDQLIAFQGSVASPTYIYAVNLEGATWQSNATSSNTSALPAGLTEGETAVGLPENDNAAYTGVSTGTKAELLAAIGAPGNWSITSTKPGSPAFPAAFTVSGGCDVGDPGDPGGGGDDPAECTPTATLTAGDCAVVGLNTDSPDDFAIVLLQAVESGTSISFTDHGVKSDGSFRASEGVFTFTAASDLDPGTVIWGSDFTTPTGFSSGGDQVIVFQGTVGSPTYLCAMNLEGSGWQSNATSSNTSAQPPGLTGASAVAIPESDNAAYSGTTSGTVADVLALIGDSGNWSTSNSTVQSFPLSFTFSDRTCE